MTQNPNDTDKENESRENHTDFKDKTRVSYKTNHSLKIYEKEPNLKAKLEKSYYAPSFNDVSIHAS